MITLYASKDLTSWTQITPISGVDYTFEFKYSDREERYYVRVLDDAVVVSPWKKILALQICAKVGSGYVICIPQDASTDPPKFGDLGGGARCSLVFVSSEEVN